jgi:DNA-binding transcriptional regulator YdaS (Cro superfamily)
MTDLYRQFSASGELLYVGISRCALTRLAAHARSSPWASDIARIEIERFSSRSAALAAETLAILNEHPRQNVKHTAAARVPHAPPVPRNTAGLAAAISKAGNKSKLARLLGISPQHVANWMSRDKRVPSTRVIEIERFTGVSRHDLRPDLYPREAA